MPQSGEGDVGGKSRCRLGNLLNVILEMLGTRSPEQADQDFLILRENIRDGDVLEMMLGKDWSSSKWSSDTPRCCMGDP